MKAHLWIGAVFVAVLCTSTALHAAQQAAPNFVIILADDMGYGDLGCYGQRVIRTPRLDRMAAEGMRFTSFYAQAFCGPSRTALMTGCYPIRVAEVGNRKELHPVVHTGEITLAEVLKARGYSTAMIGKWDLAGHSPRKYLPELLPQHQGFDLHFGTPTSNDDWRQTLLLRNGQILEDPIDLTVSTTRRYTDEAIRFIQSHREEPFFVYLAPNMPHPALHVDKEFAGRSPRGLYGDVVEELDHHVGRLLDTLRELGLADRTYVLFTSDNGPWWLHKEHAGSPGLLRGAKVSTWEGGLRVPGIVWAPGRVPAGKVCDRMASTLDALPTFAALAGADVPADRVIDGRDIRPLLAGRFDADLDDTFYYYLVTHLQAVRQGPWKLHLPRPRPVSWLRHYAPSFSPNKHIPPGDDIAIEQPMLFNLDSDIAEIHDVAASHPEVVQRLLVLAEHARQGMGDYDRIGAKARFFDPAPPRPDINDWKSDAKPLMTVLGKPLLSEDFSNPTLPAEWQPMGRSGSFVIADGSLQGTCDPRDWHGPAIGVPIDARNLTLEFSVKFVKSGFFLALVDGDSKFGGEAHLFRVAMGGGRVTLQQDRGAPQSHIQQGREQQRAAQEGRRLTPPTPQQLADPKFYRVETLATKPFSSDDGQWHHVLVELNKNEAVLQVDGAATLLATGAVLDEKKSRIVFLVGQGGTVLIDHVKAWENSPRPDWNEKRQTLSAAKPPAH